MGGCGTHRIGGWDERLRLLAPQPRRSIVTFSAYWISRLQAVVSHDPGHWLNGVEHQNPSISPAQL